MGFVYFKQQTKNPKHSYLKLHALTYCIFSHYIPKQNRLQLSHFFFLTAWCIDIIVYSNHRKHSEGTVIGKVPK